MIKNCSRCHENKPTSDFFVKDKLSGRLHAQCKECYKLHRRTYYTQHYEKYRAHYLARGLARRQKVRQEFRTNMLAYLSDKNCADCGEDDIRVLELDHIDPATKQFSISQSVKLGKSWAMVELEIAKCQILCANCHKKRTAEQFKWYKA